MFLCLFLVLICSLCSWFFPHGFMVCPRFLDFVALLLPAFFFFSPLPFCCLDFVLHLCYLSLCLCAFCLGNIQIIILYVSGYFMICCPQSPDGNGQESFKVSARNKLQTALQNVIPPNDIKVNGEIHWLQVVWAFGCCPLKRDHWSLRGFTWLNKGYIKTLHLTIYIQSAPYAVRQKVRDWVCRNWTLQLTLVSLLMKSATFPWHQPCILIA